MAFTLYNSFVHNSEASDKSGGVLYSSSLATIKFDFNEIKDAKSA